MLPPLDDGEQTQRLHHAKVFLCCVTLGYLLVELPFNARLLDVVGGLSSQSNIHHIEIYGRVISGFAAALFWWGVVTIPKGIRNDRDNPTIAIRMILIGAVLIGSVYAGERQLVHYLVHTSTGTQRREAVKLNVLSHDIETNKAGLGGIKLNGRLLSSPQGKTFIAYFPFMATHVTHLEAKIQKNMRRLVRNRIRGTIGSPRHVFNTCYRASVKKIDNAFSSYRKIVNKLASAINSEKSEAKDKWYHFRRRLHEKIGPGPIPRRFYPRIRRRLHNKGLDVPKHFRPDGKYAYFKAVYKKIKNRAYHHYRAASRQAFGTVLPTDLDSKAKFVANPHIQKMWRRAIGAGDDHALHLTMQTDYAHFRHHVYQPLVAHRVKQRMNKIQAQSSSFEAGHPNAELGRKAVRAEIVPPIALVFSVIGGFTHILKLMLMLTAVIAGYMGYRHKPSRFIRQRYVKLAITLVYVCLVASAYWMPVRITQSPLFGYFEGQMMLTRAKSSNQKPKTGNQSTWRTTLAGAQTDGRIVWADTESVFTRWIIQVQPIVYPDNEWMRNHVLDGFRYGVDQSSTS